MEKLRVAIFSDNFYPVIGGTEKAVENIANGLLENDCEVLVCVPKYGKIKYDDSKFKFSVNRCKSLKLNNNTYLPIPFFDKIFKKVLKNFNPNIIHCNTISPFSKCALNYCKKYNIPCVITVHTKYSYFFSNNINFIKKIKFKYLGCLLNKMDSVFSVCYNMKDEFLLYNFTKKFEIIKNGATFPHLQKKEIFSIKSLFYEKFNFDKKTNILLFVGRIEKEKNIEFIFESLKHLYLINKNFMMLFVGCIIDSSFVEKVKNSRVAKNVIFTGVISDQLLLKSIYLNSKIFLFPSLFDTDGLVVVEAATCKTPSIVIKNTGASERITNNFNGFIIENSAEVMAKKIYYLLLHPEILKTIGNNAEKTLPTKWSDVCKTYKSNYLCAINKKQYKVN